jgi:predicted MPP superfamily phosphohydrolase
MSGKLRKGMPVPKPAKENGIWSWHPVIRSKTSNQLKLGHLSDVHVNIRQNVLAESQASVLEGVSASQPVGDKVSNCLEALKNLFDQFGNGPAKADALVITGDLIDFNRNLCPDQAQGNIQKQWSAFNVVNNVLNQSMYPRGQDDMLMFSLVRYAYTDLQLPVFLERRAA